MKAEKQKSREAGNAEKQETQKQRSRKAGTTQKKIKKHSPPQ